MIRFTALSLIGLIAITSPACEKPGAAEKQQEQRANAELQQAKDQAVQREQGAQRQDPVPAPHRPDGRRMPRRAA